MLQNLCYSIFGGAILQMVSFSLELSKKLSIGSFNEILAVS